MSTLYHLTSIDHLQNIMKNGLIPQVGENCKRIGEEKAAIFLCEKKDVGKWRIMIGNTILLTLEGIDITALDKREYPKCSEYRSFKPIAPEHIKAVHYDTGYSPADMEELCSSYLLALSQFTVDCAYYYGSGELNPDEQEFLYSFARDVLTVLRQLDYSIKPMEFWVDVLKDYSDCGEYTFCELYDSDNNIRLWQQLIRYEEDELCGVLFEIYDFIEKTLPFATELCTGEFGV